MKKAYKTPITTVVMMSLQGLLLVGSGVTSGNGIGYGGTDEDGSQDPAARRHRNDVWEEEQDAYQQ